MWKHVHGFGETQRYDEDLIQFKSYIVGIT
jgi:hypothetical protein